MITQATYDILDSSLREGQKKYHAYDNIDRQKMYSHWLRVDPHRADEKYQLVPKLTWEGPYRYCEMPDFEQLINSEKIGIYIMYTRPVNLLLDMTQHVMYVGISGERGSSRPLKKRLMDYFNIGKLELRSNIHVMLQMYYEHVYIKYSLFDGTHQDLEKLEVLLHEFFYPKFGKRDFEPETKKAQSAWNTGQ